MNYLEALNYGNSILKIGNIKSHEIDSELLLSKVLEMPREQILINLKKKIDGKKLNLFKNLLLRRKKNEPIAYIFKKKNFWKYTFKVSKDVLIPRPETEQIIEEVLKVTEFNSSKNFLDVGTGSGCIILSILKERPNCYGTAIDISKKSLEIARINAKMHHLKNKIKFINIDVDKFNLNKYDLIVSNPPYIKASDLKRLDYDVRLYEPFLALKAGIDGLSEIRKLIFKSKILLKKNGKLIFEIGNGQKYKVIKLLKNNGFYINKICKDLQSHPRVIISTKFFI